MQSILELIMSLFKTTSQQSSASSAVAAAPTSTAPASEATKAEPAVALPELITRDQILMGRVAYENLSADEQRNVDTLVQRVNEFFKDYKWPLQKKVNDGYRRPQDRPANGAAMSLHFVGGAVDLDDDDAGTTWKYIFANRDKLKEIGLWMEHPCWTHYSGGTWVHMQIAPPKSGRRFYVPSSAPNPNPSFWDGKYEATLDGKDKSGI